MPSVHIDMNTAKWPFCVFHRVGDLRAAAWRLRISTVRTRVASHFSPDKYNHFTKLHQRLLLVLPFRAYPLFFVLWLFLFAHRSPNAAHL